MYSRRTKPTMKAPGTEKRQHPTRFRCFAKCIYCKETIQKFVPENVSDLFKRFPEQTQPSNLLISLAAGSDTPKLSSVGELVLLNRLKSFLLLLLLLLKFGPFQHMINFRFCYIILSNILWLDLLRSRIDGF